MTATIRHQAQTLVVDAGVMKIDHGTLAQRFTCAMARRPSWATRRASVAQGSASGASLLPLPSLGPLPLVRRARASSAWSTALLDGRRSMEGVILLFALYK